MVTCVACGVCLMMIAMLTRGGLASDETCKSFFFCIMCDYMFVSVDAYVRKVIQYLVVDNYNDTLLLVSCLFGQAQTWNLKA